VEGGAVDNAAVGLEVILLTWGPECPAVTAPDQAAISALELFGMRRVPGDPRALEFPGEVRYRIGYAHRR
jgi:hypothetical protein